MTNNTLKFIFVMITVAVLSLVIIGNSDTQYNSIMKYSTYMIDLSNELSIYNKSAITTSEKTESSVTTTYENNAIATFTMNMTHGLFKKLSFSLEYVSDNKLTPDEIIKITSYMISSDETKSMDSILSKDIQNEIKNNLDNNKPTDTKLSSRNYNLYIVQTENVLKIEITEQ